MDQSLKQRLIGVTIAVALVVIFVPMLFEKSDDKGKSSLAGIPAIPEDVLEKPLELPKTAEDLAPKEEEKEKAKAPAESGYRIVPLNEEPVPPKPNTAATKTAQGEAVEAEEEGETAAAPGGEEDDEAGAAAPPAKPEPSAAKAAPPVPAKAAKAAAKPEAPKPPVSHLAEPTKPATQHPAAAHEPAKPATKTTDAAAKKADPAASKPATAKSAEPRPTAIKTVKVNKPKPAALARDTDEAEEPIPAPAKPKPTAAQPNKKPETAKSAAAQATAKTDKAAASAKTAAKPAEAGGAAKPAPPKKTWAVQAGSFTDEAAAKNMADKLKQSKFQASVHPAQGPNGTVYRVQVGAEQDRSRAEETLKKIQGSTGVSGVITPRH